MTWIEDFQVINEYYSIGEFAKVLPTFCVYSDFARPLTSQVFVQWLYLMLDFFEGLFLFFLKVLFHLLMLTKLSLQMEVVRTL